MQRKQFWRVARKEGRFFLNAGDISLIQSLWSIFQLRTRLRNSEEKFYYWRISRPNRSDLQKNNIFELSFTLYSKVSSPPAGAPSIVISVSVCVSVCLFVCMYVCLSVCLLPYLKKHVQNFTKFSVQASLAVVRSFSDRSTICCMHFRVCGSFIVHIMERMGQNQRRRVCFVHFAG